MDAPVVDRRGLPAGISALDYAVNQSDGGVVLNLERIRQLANRRRLGADMTPNRDQGLVLLRRQTGLSCRLLAESDELTKRRPERGQRLEILTVSGFSVTVRFVMAASDAAGPWHRNPR